MAEDHIVRIDFDFGYPPDDDLLRDAEEVILPPPGKRVFLTRGEWREVMEKSGAEGQDRLLGVAVIGCIIVGAAGILLSLISLITVNLIASAFFLIAGGISCGLLVHALVK